MSVLDKVQLPKDIKKMNNSELDELCADIRELLVETVSETGGHLASNLGVVELSVALHKVFNSPTDQIVFDVGHQCYTHKILTGRKDRFSTLRTEGGISGFVRPVESEHDIFSSGHSSVAISQAIGLAKAKKIKGEKGKVIAVIGDGALTGGLAYEAFNNGSYGCENLIVILNDNNMSISQNVGSMSKHLTTIRTSKQYFTFKAGVRRIFAKIPKIGNSVNRLVTFINTEIRKKVYHATVKKVTSDYEALAFNTAISQLMVFINAVYKEDVFPREYAEGFIKLLNPIAPHITEELWSTVLGHDDTIAFESWPKFDESKIVEDFLTIGVQVNGKLRGTITVPVDSTEDQIKESAFEEENVKRHTDGKEIVKVIVIKGKIVNIVIK